jgi:hypothetical protein
MRRPASASLLQEFLTIIVIMASTESASQQLWTAAQEGRADDVLAALERVEPLYKHCCIRRAVAVAAFNDHADVVRELLRRHSGDFWCMEHVMKGAASRGSLQVMEAALTFPASRMFVATGMYVACDHGHADMVRLLLSANADVDWSEGGGDNGDGDENDAPVRRICRTGHCNVQVLQTLLLAKAYIHESCSPSNIVYDATCTGRADVVQVLADAKADVDAHGGVWRSTPLFEASSRGALHMMRALLHAKADVDRACDLNGYTPVMIAIACGKSDALRLLVSAKADVNVPNKDGETAAAVARKYSRDDVLRILLDAKADAAQP